MSNTLIHFEIAGEDPERLGRFYAGLFGWKVEQRQRVPYRECSGSEL